MVLHAYMAKQKSKYDRPFAWRLGPWYCTFVVGYLPAWLCACHWAGKIRLGGTVQKALQWISCRGSRNHRIYLQFTFEAFCRFCFGDASGIIFFWIPFLSANNRPTGHGWRIWFLTWHLSGVLRWPGTRSASTSLWPPFPSKLGGCWCSSW